MKIAQIAGFLGSGKTTALMRIVDGLVSRKNRVAIVVNDVGDISVDAKFIEAHGLKAKEISGGCICCQIAGSFAETLAMLHDSFDPDIVIVEPSGVAIPWGLKRAASSFACWMSASFFCQVSSSPFKLSIVVRLALYC